jgi:hypothetical protein
VFVGEAIGRTEQTTAIRSEGPEEGDVTGRSDIGTMFQNVMAALSPQNSQRNAGAAGGEGSARGVGSMFQDVMAALSPQSSARPLADPTDAQSSLAEDQVRVDVGNEQASASLEEEEALTYRDDPEENAPAGA